MMYRVLALVAMMLVGSSGFVAPASAVTSSAVRTSSAVTMFGGGGGAKGKKTAKKAVKKAAKKGKAKATSGGLDTDSLFVHTTNMLDKSQYAPTLIGAPAGRM